MKRSIILLCLGTFLLSACKAAEGPAPLPAPNQDQKPESSAAAENS